MSPHGSPRRAMGVDIESGSPGSARALYSVALLEEGGSIVYSSRSVPLSRVIRLAWEYRPDLIALDNLYELGQSEGDVLRVLSLLPPSSEVVLVTLDRQEGFQSIREVARRAGLDLGEGKPSPLKTAVALASLALSGYGVPIRSVEEKTLIVVSRARSGKGGWSQQRYQRRGRASVGGVVNLIREALDKAGLDYDMYYRRSEGGIDSALIVVYAPISRVQEIVKPYRGREYLVKLKPVYRSRLLPLREEAPPTRPVIVGLDPGITTGLAIIDLEGRVLYADSGKGMDRGRILDVIRGYGKPVVVAVDVREPPEAARKLAAQLGAELYTPSHDLTPAEKREVVERHLGRAPEDSHVRDALAAALKAYNAVKSKLEQIEAYILDKGIDVDPERVKSLVLQGLSLADALERLIEERLAQEAKPPETGEGKRRRAEEARRREGREPNAALVEAYEALRLEKEKLEARIRELEDRIYRLERALETARQRGKSESQLKMDLEIQRRRVRELEEELEELRQKLGELEVRARRLESLLWEAGRGHLVAVRVVERATPSALSESHRLHGPLDPGEIVYVRSADGFTGEFVKRLKEVDVAGVILDYPESPLGNALRRSRIPVLPLGALKHEWASRHLLLVESRVLDLLEEAKEELEARSLDLERILEEYRKSRMGRR